MPFQPSELMTAPAFRTNDTYQTLHLLDPSSEGDVSIVRSSSTQKVLVVKHTYSTNSNPNPRPGFSSYPNEAHILLRALRRRTHPNIITLFGAQLSGLQGRWNLYMEYCSGGDLLAQMDHFRTILKGGKVPEIFVLHVFVGVARALAFLHHGLKFVREGKQKGEGVYEKLNEGQHEAIIHGDIKPENVFLRWHHSAQFDGQELGLPTIVLADFGCAALASQSKGICGTPGYDSPEVLHAASRSRRSLQRNAKGIMTTKSDVYQFGLLIYQLCTYERWETGRDPAGVKLPLVGEGGCETREVEMATRWCLKVSAEERASVSLEEGKGLLRGVEWLRGVRDELGMRDGGVKERLWRRK